MIYTLLISLLFNSAAGPKDSLQDFSQYLARSLALCLKPPPEYGPSDSCYQYMELLKVEIDKSSRVVSLIFSDSAPGWLVKDLKKKRDIYREKFEKMDSIAAKGRLRNCIYIFPIKIESVDFPCAKSKEIIHLDKDYFKFDGKNLSGNISFADELRIIYPKPQPDRDDNYPKPIKPEKLNQ